MALGRLGEDLPIEWVSTERGRLANSKPFAELEWAATGYFGNEACHTAFYTRAVLVVTVPDAGSRAVIAAVRPDRALTAEQVHAAAPPSSTTASSKKRPADGMANGAGGSSRGGAIDLTSDAAETTIAATAATAAATATSASSSSFSSSSSSSSASSHVLYAAAAPTHSATGPRTIHVEGGEGGRSAHMGGKCDVVLHPGEGLRELKKLIRDAFGKYKYHVLGSLRLEGEGRDAKKEDLVDGATVRCTYTYQSGNGNLGGFLGRGGGFGRGGFACRGFW